MDSQDKDSRLGMIASYGYRSSRKLPTSFLPGEGLVGQCAIEKQRIWLTNVPRDYIQVSSGLGAAPPTNIVVLPILFEQQVKAVIEIASLDRFTETHLSFLDQLMESIGVVLNTIEANSRTESLLTQSQSLAQELQQTNLELAEKARLLSEQNIEVERKNREVEQAKLALEEKAKQLALSSKYKSEFLANMSHELRTPLNSLLILAQQLSDNPDGNLSERQVEFAKTIYGSGSDLLTLINDILDLSKIESGTVTLEVSECRFRVLRGYVERTFRHMAEAKNLGFSVDLAENLPIAMMTDTTRMQQILKNLLSNAFKFTSHGQVSLNIGLAGSGWTSDHPHLAQADAVLAFSVTDTGVGIPSDKLQLIFEAFQQADGSTARKYGGTGLGLSISRELARLLGGEIRVESVVGVGSTFTLYLPYNRAGFVNLDLPRQALSAPQAPAVTTNVVYTDAQALAVIDDVEVERMEILGHEMPVVEYEAAYDDRSLVSPGEASVLIVEDDSRFAKVVLDYAREKNFKGIVTHQGDAVLTLARDYLPAAILLDIDLPDVDGFTVLDRLKRDPSTRHIPVHVISSLKERERALRQGAISYLHKPVSRERLQEEFTRIQNFLVRGKRSLLVVEDDQQQRDAIVSLLGATDVHIVAVTTGKDALDALKSSQFDCMVLDLTLPDINGFELLDQIGDDANLRELPVVVYTAKELNRKEVTRLKRIAKTIVVKDARSPERLLDETALFLHRAHADLPEMQRRMLDEIQAADSGLAGRKVLIVDDDLRNIFALSSVLERQKMKVSFAENGRDGIEVLEQDPSIEIVLMDIMMPEMDGYDTMRAIRSVPKFKTLPIVTLTAKAMKGDRDKCIAAGASDYITKPVDVAQLLSLMRVWLHQSS
jgi:CheY-like chemotaxis protein/signal transduction histidine kinase